MKMSARRKSNLPKRMAVDNEVTRRYHESESEIKADRPLETQRKTKDRDLDTSKAQDKHGVNKLVINQKGRKNALNPRSPESKKTMAATMDGKRNKAKQLTRPRSPSNTQGRHNSGIGSSSRKRTREVYNIPDQESLARNLSKKKRFLQDSAHNPGHARAGRSRKLSSGGAKKLSLSSSAFEDINQYADDERNNSLLQNTEEQMQDTEEVIGLAMDKGIGLDWPKTQAEVEERLIAEERPRNTLDESSVEQNNSEDNEFQERDEEEEEDEANGDTEFLVDPSQWRNASAAEDSVGWDCDIEGDHDPLLESLKLQKQRRRSRRSNTGCSSSRDAYDSDEDTEPSRESVREEWDLQYHQKGREFYYGDEAQLKLPAKRLNTSTGKTRASPYYGILLLPKNNFDMRHSYRNFYKGMMNNTGEGGTFENYKIAVGQLAKLGIATSRLDPDTVWDKGELFKLAECKLVFQVFLQHFEESGTHGSVMNKATILAKFVRIATDYFSKNPLYGTDQVRNLRMEGRLAQTARYCNQMASVNKKRHRASKIVTKEEEHRKRSGKLITETDFDTFRATALRELEDIMETSSRLFVRQKAVDIRTKKNATSHLFSTKSLLLRKWCLNFLVLLILCGNGQRNEVYWMLVAPETDELDLVEETNREAGKMKVALKIGFVRGELEKRPRDIRLPYVIFDASIVKFVRFHVEFVRPFLHEAAHHEKNPKFSHLLLDTRSGLPLNSRLIRVAFSTWVKQFDKDLHLTPMDIRACFATYMIRRYVRRALQGKTGIVCSFENLNEVQFLEMLSAVMNTSVEQLRTVYAAATYTAYADQVAHVLNICKSSNDEVDEV